MTLNARVQVPMPEKGIIIERNKANRPVHKITRVYRNEKGQPTNDRVVIGRQHPETGKLIPNPKY